LDVVFFFSGTELSCQVTARLWGCTPSDGAARGAPSPAAHARRRPERGTLEALVGEAAELPCVVPEQAALQAALERFDRWQRAMAALVTGHKAACAAGAPSSSPGVDDGAGPEPGPRRLPAAALSQAAKSALSLELDCGELAGRVLTALRSERWRGRVRQALAARVRPTGAHPAPVRRRRASGPPTCPLSTEVCLRGGKGVRQREAPRARVAWQPALPPHLCRMAARGALTAARRARAQRTRW